MVGQLFGGSDADRANAVLAILQEKAEIVLFRSSASLCLPTTEPSFGCKVLEERDKPAAPIVIPRLNWEGASDRLLPIVVVQKSRIGDSATAYLAKRARLVALECNDGMAVGNSRFRSIFI